MSTSNVHCLSWLFTSQIFVPGGSIGKNKESLLIIAQYLFCSLQPFSHLSIIILAIFYCNCAFLSGAFLILNVNSSREISLQLGCLCEESMNKPSSREGEENPPDQSNRMVPRELHGGVTEGLGDSECPSPLAFMEVTYLLNIKVGRHHTGFSCLLRQSLAVVTAQPRSSCREGKHEVAHGDTHLSSQHWGAQGGGFSGKDLSVP